jgi:ABC-type amino acid transport substrate-binding protein
MTISPEPRSSRSFAKVLARISAVTATGALLASCGSGSGSEGTSESGGESAGEALLVGSDLTYPPYAYFEGDTPAGFDPDITAAMAEEMGVSVEYKDTRFEQLIPGLQSGQFDVIASALYITSERAQEVDFIPYFSTGNSILVREGEEPLETAADLCGKAVSVIKGGDIVQRLREDASTECTEAGEEPIDVREFTTDPEATQAMISGQVDAQLTDAGVASTLGDNADVAVEISSTELLYPIPVGLGVEKGNTELVEKLETALQALKDNGTYEELLQQYNLSAPDGAQVEEILAETP